MKVGRGFVVPMSKRRRKRTSHRHSPFLYTATLIVLGVSLVLTGCGELSLNQLLENQEPGELSISPRTAMIGEGRSIEITGKGGFTPYTFSATVGSIDEIEGSIYYTAPNSPEVVTITLADGISSEATATITVFTPVELSPAAKTIDEGDTVDFEATGGFPDPNYDFLVNGVLEESTTGLWSHEFLTEGTYTVEVMDDLDNSAVSTITVEGGMAIVALRNWVVKGTDPATDPYHETTLTAINEYSPQVFSIETSGSAAEVGWLELDSYAPYLGPPYTYDDTAVYHAPDSEAVVLIQLKDWVGNIATVDIRVLSEPPEPLSLNPTVMTVATNAENVQLSASGGIPEHSFWIFPEGDPEEVGYLSEHPTQEFRIRYNAPSDPTTVSVWVEDALGRQAKATIHVVEGQN
jgi:hypothetical protein